MAKIIGSLVQETLNAATTSVTHNNVLRACIRVIIGTGAGAGAVRVQAGAFTRDMLTTSPDWEIHVWGTACIKELTVAAYDTTGTPGNYSVSVEFYKQSENEK